MRRALAAAAVVALAGAAAGCGGSSGPDETAGAFMTRILQEELDGRWAAQWTDLHPGHQKLISRAQYVACSQGLGTDSVAGKLTVGTVRDQEIHVRGVPERTAKLVTIVLTPPGDSAPVVYRLHAVLDDGRWRWILGDSFLESIARGECLDGSPFGQTT